MGDDIFSKLGDIHPFKNDADMEIKVPTSVEVPRYEYARLVRDSERFATVKKLVTSLDAYDLKKVVDVLFTEAKDD